MTTRDELYAAEQKQADIDHHAPTAGAMVGHIVANLWIQQAKLLHVKWFAKGPLAYAIEQLTSDLLIENRRQLDELGALLLDENELPPSTTEEFAAYTHLQEDPRLKYDEANTMLTVLAEDYVTANMFIDRAIVLAQKEVRPALAQWLTTLRGENNYAIRLLQAINGKTAWEGLIEEDEDEDD